MKAGINGVLNLSIIDGWFDEAYEISGGWAIGDRESCTEDQDEIHASAIYSLLENEIVPLYYEGRDEGVPEEWMGRVKQSLRNLSPRYNSQRMLDQYIRQLYEPAHATYSQIREHGFHAARKKATWSREVERLWHRIDFVQIDGGPDGPVYSGKPIPMRTAVELAGLTPDDVRVEAVVGRIGVNGQLEDTEVLTLSPVEQTGTVFVFAKEFVPHHTGRLGFSVRVSANHYNDPLTRPCHSLLKWGGTD
jgi:starch phosphorylase